MRHGLVSTYNNHGCRCGECREAATRRRSVLKAVKHGQRIERNGVLVHPLAPHGTESGYGYWGCRCPFCRSAHSFDTRTRKTRNRINRKATT